MCSFDERVKMMEVYILGEESLDGRPALVFHEISVSSEGHYREKVFVDMKTGVLQKRERQTLIN